MVNIQGRGNPQRLAFGDFQFDPATTDLRRASGGVRVTPKALALLEYLVSRRERLVSKRELLDALWPEVFVGDNVLTVCVSELRHALDDHARAPWCIETAHRRGYRFIAPVRELDDAPARHPHGVTSDGDADGLLDESERFVSQERQGRGGSRILATILCATPSMGRTMESDQLSVTLEMLLRTEAASFHGGAIERSGDRVTVTFDRPARAVRCGRAMSAAASRQGLPLKIGVHAGDCDLIAGVARGLAAEISGRIARLAETGEVLVSRTVVDLMAGSGWHFSDRGAHQLADDVYDWHVFAVAHDPRAH